MNKAPNSARLLSTFLVIAALCSAAAQTPEQVREKRLQWWREVPFGMFIHWGLYAVPAGEWKGKPIAGLGEWIMNRAKIPVAEYEQLAKQFNPVKFNADEWVAVARSAGAKYIVITSKHHDGFAMYGSKVSKYNIVDATPFHRDPMKELAAACQKAGIKLCFYYSQTQDWHEPDGNGNTWDWPDEFFRLRPQGDGFANREEPRGDGDFAVRRGRSSARFDGHGRGVAQLRSLRTSRGLRADERHRASGQPEVACLGRSQNNNYWPEGEVPMRRLGGSSTLSSSTISPLVFTGISTFSNDFQTVLTRAVSIASLPLKQLQNSDSDVLQQKQLLGSLGDGVGALGTSIAALGKIAQNKALVAGSSDSATVSVQATGATEGATYTISNITSVASAASETSKTGYADSGATQISSTGTVRLVIGSNHYDIGLTPATNNLVGLRDAINKLGVGVTASVLTTGTGLNPNYLSISANSSGATTLQILDDPTGANTNLITSTNQGSNAVFTLNGVPVTKSDNVINNVIAGVTFTIEKETTLTAPTVTLSLTTDATQLQSAIQDFVTKYNSLVDQVGGQVGPAAGLLSGDFIVREVQSDLRKVTSYQGTGSIQSLSDLGIQAGVDGKLTFDTNVFSALSNSQITSAFDFLGSPTTGFGALADKFSQITDPTSGLIKLEQDGFEAADKRIQSSIGDLNDRISQLQTSMTTRLQAADALQAQLASQQQQLSAILQSLNFTSFGAPGASTNGSTGVG